jgi:hypothetical protein
VTDLTDLQHQTPILRNGTVRPERAAAAATEKLIFDHLAQRAGITRPFYAPTPNIGLAGLTRGQ